MPLVKLNGSIADRTDSKSYGSHHPTPSEVYKAIYESFTTNDTFGINEEDYVAIGDCRIKVNMKNGFVTYYIRENK